MIATLLGMAAKGLISEKAMKKVVLTLGDLLVKSTKNDMDDKIWKEVRKVLSA